VIDDPRAYTALMTVLGERLPELHDQIADEVARGRELRGTDIEWTEREGRDRRLGDEKLGRIAESDVSVFPYSGEERLDLLIDALRTSAETLDQSLNTLSDLLTEQSIADRRIYFQRPESGETASVELPPAREGVSPEADIARRLNEVDRSLEADRRERGHR
jgi:hypothetical protein